MSLIKIKTWYNYYFKLKINNYFLKYFIPNSYWSLESYQEKVAEVIPTLTVITLEGLYYIYIYIIIIYLLETEKRIEEIKSKFGNELKQYMAEVSNVKIEDINLDQELNKLLQIDTKKFNQLYLKQKAN